MPQRVVVLNCDPRLSHVEMVMYGSLTLVCKKEHPIRWSHDAEDRQVRLHDPPTCLWCVASKAR